MNQLQIDCLPIKLGLNTAEAPPHITIYYYYYCIY